MHRGTEKYCSLKVTHFTPGLYVFYSRPYCKILFDDLVLFTLLFKLDFKINVCLYNPFVYICLNHIGRSFLFVMNWQQISITFILFEFKHNFRAQVSRRRGRAPFAVFLSGRRGRRDASNASFPASKCLLDWWARATPSLPAYAVCKLQNNSIKSWICPGGTEMEWRVLELLEVLIKCKLGQKM